ncbi:hypothetical protein BJY01DRAFT_244891 [Aspergillus pseudoustus]|uniref:Uncharacterized protein n=1 Tax=Aspergillus pseudoustus TaxID=1810923 RepID=A0ABR4KGZ7_9EURO
MSPNADFPSSSLNKCPATMDKSSQPNGNSPNNNDKKKKEEQTSINGERVRNTSELWVYKSSKHGTPPFKLTGFELRGRVVDYAVNDDECRVRVAPFPKLTGEEGKGLYFTQGGDFKIGAGKVLRIMHIPMFIVVTPCPREGDDEEGNAQDEEDTRWTADRFVNFTINHYTDLPPELGTNIPNKPGLGDFRVGFWVSHAGYLKIGRGAVTRVIENLELVIVDHPEKGTFV